MASTQREYSFYTGAKFNRHTILQDGRGQIAGRIGEAEFAKQLCFHAPQFCWSGPEKTPYDFIVRLKPDVSVTIDVKTKKRNVPVQNHYSAHVTLSQRNYDVDVYVFANETKGCVSLMGWCSKNWFWDHAVIVSEGDREQAGNSFEERDEAGKLLYSELRPMKEMWEKLDSYSG